MGGLNIDHGGAISVDPDAMRDTARSIDALSDEFGRARAAVRRACDVILSTTGFGSRVDVSALTDAGEEVAHLRDECENAAVGTRLMADVFEYVELQVRADALALHDEAAAERLRARMAQLAAADPRIPDMAAMRIADWSAHRFDGFDQQDDWHGLLSPLFGAVALVGSFSGRGTVWPWSRLTGTADPVTVTPVSSTRQVRPPAGVQDAVERMPSAADGAQVAVEKLTMPDGRTTYIAYIAGTQSPLYGGSEPWDMKSNAELYTGQTSASYQATLDALAAAGAQPGDQVDVVAHSQAGMIAAYLSHESGYDVTLQISLGSPVVDVADPDQTLVRLAHTDDPVYRLSDGGTATASGAPGSFVATRVDDPAGLSDPWDPHLLESYADLARDVDASSDPRVADLDVFWDEFGRAVSVERTEYHAERAG